MKLHMYAIHDGAVDAYGVPFFVANDAVASALLILFVLMIALLSIITLATSLFITLVYMTMELGLSYPHLLGL